MSTTFRHDGKSIPVATASGAITSGAFVVQEGFFGIASKAMASGASGWIDIVGVHLIAVPSGTVKSDLLYAPGAPATESAGVTLTKTSGGNTKVGRAVGDRDANGKALVLLLPQE